MEKEALLIGAEDLSVYEDACKEENISLRIVNDQKSALEAINERKPGLILVDYEGLQEASMEICQTLKKFPGTQHLPLIFIVPHTQLQALVEVLFIPVNDYIFSPLNLEDFKLRLRAQYALSDFKNEKKLISVEEKIDELEKLLKIFPDYTAARQELAEIYEKTGRVPDALQAFLQLAKEYHQQHNFGLAMDVISKMKTSLAKQSHQIGPGETFSEAIDRCLKILNKN